MTRLPDDHHRLGRRHADDPLDNAYLARALGAIPAIPAHRYRYWWSRFNYDQTGPTCTANAAFHLLGDSPRSVTAASLDARYPAYVAQCGQAGWRGYAYDVAQGRDEFEDTPPAGGTSFRAMAKVMQDGGWITSYLWLRGVEEIATAVLDHGPVAVGLDLLGGMYFDVQPGGWWTATGSEVGGHEVVLDGCSAVDEKFRIQTWGVHYWIRYADLERAITLHPYDAALVTESA